MASSNTDHDLDRAIEFRLEAGARAGDVIVEFKIGPQRMRKILGHLERRLTAALPKAVQSTNLMALETAGKLRRQHRNFLVAAGVTDLAQLQGRSRRLRHFGERLGPQFAANGVLFAGLALAGVWWAYPLLWLLPLLTWMMVVGRIRNIAEHAVVPDSDDPLRNTRTTKAGFIERAFIAPYFVNYHLEHHLLMYVPCYNLPKVHAILMRGPHAARMEVQPNYLSVLRMATAVPNAHDRRGAVVDNARRMRSGASNTEDRASAGF
jgi:hypothetical protein